MNKTNLDLSKYDFSYVPRVEKVIDCGKYQVVIFDRIFNNVHPGDCLAKLGDEFVRNFVKEVIFPNTIILESESEMGIEIGSAWMYRSELITKNAIEEVFAPRVSEYYDDLARYFVDRINELYPLMATKEQSNKPDVHEAVIDYFSQFNEEKQLQIIEALKSADVILDKGKTIFKNISLNDSFDKSEWDAFFKDVFNKIKF